MTRIKRIMDCAANKKSEENLSENLSRIIVNGSRNTMVDKVQ